MWVLLTGMSGTGKSALVGELRRRGYAAYDADEDGFSEPRADGRWGWRADEVADLLTHARDGFAFFAGCSEEQAELPFDLRVLLTAPRPLLVERLRTRSGNDYGRGAAELSQVLRDLDEVEPLLRRSADLVLNTTAPTETVADALLRSIAMLGRGAVVESAVAAAVAVATEQGLRVDDAVPVGTGSNVIVHLRPSPVVARVMSGTVVLHPDPRAWLTREIDVGTFLGERIAEVVAPTKEIDPGPYVSGNRWMSFWEHVDVRDEPLEAREIGRALRDLHDALAEYRGPLPPRSEVLGEIDWLLNALSGDHGVAELSAERDRLAEVILDHGHEGRRQPIHGDASLSNLLATTGGPCWNDLEDVCIGTIEWDLAGVLSDARAAHGDAFRADVLAAYGDECDPAALQRVDQVHALYGDLWRRYRRRTAAGA